LVPLFRAGQLRNLGERKLGFKKGGVLFHEVLRLHARST
jgi:hypothetical protein